MKLELIKKRTILETIPFNVEEIDIRSTRGESRHPYYRLDCADWVNILPITTNNKALLIRQPRAGVLGPVLEVPGGMIDPGEKDPTMAALRELEEETGYTSQRVLPLGSINPNPAIMTNRCHFFLALGCHLNPARKHFPDAEESIEVVETEISDLDRLVRFGEINHALAALCIMLASKYIKIGEAK
jgi:8-oxo-dGTP pyrophosphatase MutT (NUDIX family)